MARTVNDILESTLSEGRGGDGMMGKPSKNVWDTLVNGSLAKLEDEFSKIDETFARCWLNTSHFEN